MMNTANLLRSLGWLPSSVAENLFRRWPSAALGGSALRRPAADHGLIELDARTLRDIGAPPGLLARAQQRRQTQCARRDELRGGGAAGDWQHW